MNNPKKAVVLSSGGLDSTTVMALAKHEGFEIFSLSFDYGQRHAFELEAARKVAAALGAKKHLKINIDLQKIGGSALTDDIDVPKASSSEVDIPTYRGTEAPMSQAIPVTYVPARNTIFLAYALAWAEILQSSDIFIGVNAVDYSGYPDCRPEYIESFQQMANLATKAAVENNTKIKIRTPLIYLTKAQIIQKGIELGIDYVLTHSCYDPGPEGLACGRCDSCILRKKGFQEAGVADPTLYVK